MDWIYSILEAENFNEIVEKLNNSEINVISTGNFYGINEPQLKEILQHPNLKGVSLMSPDDYDISILNSYTGLQYISLGDTEQAIDFNEFPKLIELTLSCEKKFTFPMETSPLQRLSISNYNPPSNDLTGINLKNLESLIINTSNITTLNGIERNQTLKALEIISLKKLKSIQISNESNIERFFINSCRKIDDWGEFSLGSLRRVLIEKCGTIESLNNFRELPNIKQVGFLKTKVLDQM